MMAGRLHRQPQREAAADPGFSICLQGFDREIYDAVRETLCRQWNPQLKSEDEESLSGVGQTNLVFRLGGNDAFESSSWRGPFAIRVFETLFNAGWLVTSASDTNTAVFRYQVPAPAPCGWAALHFPGTHDSLALLDVPGDLRDALLDLGEQGFFERHWPSSIENVYMIEMAERVSGSSGRSESELAPENFLTIVDFRPLRSRSFSTVTRKTLFLLLLSVLDKQGWSVYNTLALRGPGWLTWTTSTTWICRMSKA